MLSSGFVLTPSTRNPARKRIKGEPVINYKEKIQEMENELAKVTRAYRRKVNTLIAKNHRQRFLCEENKGMVLTVKLENYEEFDIEFSSKADLAKFIKENYKELTKASK